MDAILISKATRCPTANVELSWPFIASCLKELGMGDKLVLIAAAATIAIETGWKFIPIKEFGGDSYFTRMYEGRRDLGNIVQGDGPRFAGRGFVQITGRANYQDYGHKIGVDLLDDPDKALQPNVSAMILATFFLERGIPVAARNADWKKVRRIVNGGTNGLEDFLQIVANLEQLSEEDLL